MRRWTQWVRRSRSSLRRPGRWFVAGRCRSARDGSLAWPQCVLCCRLTESRTWVRTWLKSLISGTRRRRPWPSVGAVAGPQEARLRVDRGHLDRFAPGVLGNDPSDDERVVVAIAHAGVTSAVMPTNDVTQARSASSGCGHWVAQDRTARGPTRNAAADDCQDATLSRLPAPAAMMTG